jgi:hypothetical protein
VTIAEGLLLGAEPRLAALLSHLVLSTPLDQRAHADEVKLRFRPGEYVFGWFAASLRERETIEQPIGRRTVRSCDMDVASLRAGVFIVLRRDD